ncbi:hypothetical protein BU17DRAFT_88790 [Hysterangium stoloniferum]|nr:hypothetical protein BU17DRAFT_88790 [Hysterangium stoloniferum]
MPGNEMRRMLMNLRRLLVPSRDRNRGYDGKYNHTKGSLRLEVTETSTGSRILRETERRRGYNNSAAPTMGYGNLAVRKSTRIMEEKAYGQASNTSGVKARERIAEKETRRDDVDELATPARESAIGSDRDRHGKPHSRGDKETERLQQPSGTGDGVWKLSSAKID